jgi:transposase-like protein
MTINATQTPITMARQPWPEIPAADLAAPLEDIVRAGARMMLASALVAEAEAYCAQAASQLDDNGHRLVVRNGYLPQREITTGAGPVEVKAPRVNDRRENQAFTSVIWPRWARKTASLETMLPLLYLHGLSSGDFASALEEFLGTGKGLSAATVTRLAAQWGVEADRWGKRDLGEYVYVWADGVYLKVRLGGDKVCLLVLLGVRPDGSKELIAVGDGLRESSEAWADLLRDCARRGMPAPKLAIGDGALGFWKALTDVFPQTKEQRCWFHKSGNVLGALPKSQHPGAVKAVREIHQAAKREDAVKAAAAFTALYGVKWPKAAAKINDDLDELLAFFDFPAPRWVHLRTTNPIESVFSTVKARTKVTRGAGSKAAAVGMAFKLMESASRTWNPLNGAPLVAQIWAGVKYEDGEPVTSQEPGTPENPAGPNTPNHKN